MNLPFYFLLFSLSAVLAATEDSQRIVGGSTTSIRDYPFSASLLYSSFGFWHSHYCGGSLITTRTILTAAQCIDGIIVANFQWRARLGSSLANSGGTVYSPSSLIVHGYYNSRTYDYDVALFISSKPISLVTGSVEIGAYALSGYNLGDDVSCYAIGWGRTSTGSSKSELLRDVVVRSINQATCKSRFAVLGVDYITDNMLCAGWLDIGGRGICKGDGGSPLIHNDVIVGITSWGHSNCGTSYYPDVYTRVSKLSSWIQSHSQ